MIKRLFFKTKQIKNLVDCPHKLIDRHFVYEYQEDHVMVLTTRPLSGINNYLVSNVNIKGENKAQYVSGHYKVDKANVILKNAPEGQKYLAENVEKFKVILTEVKKTPPIDISRLIEKNE